MSLKIYLNGKLVDKADATVSVFDHGLLYGDGVFEGIRSYDGLVFKLREHLDRLYESAHTLMLEIPLTKTQMEKAVVETLKANRLKDAYIRLVVTRGPGDLGLDPRKCAKATVFIITDKISLYPKEFYEKGLSIVTVPTVRNHPEALNPQLKTLNYLNNILAKIEAINAGSQEALLLNSQGYVTECTGENVFLLKGKNLLTPPPYVGILKGITRDAVMRLGRRRRMRLHVRERRQKVGDAKMLFDVRAFLFGAGLAKIKLGDLLVDNLGQMHGRFIFSAFIAVHVNSPCMERPLAS